MDKRVLLPTDYSKNALNAIRYALELYKNVLCDFYILNAFHVSGYTLDSMRVPETGEPYYEAAKEESEESPTAPMLGFWRITPATVRSSRVSDLCQHSFLL